MKLSGLIFYVRLSEGILKILNSSSVSKTTYLTKISKANTYKRNHRKQKTMRISLSSLLYFAKATGGVKIFTVIKFVVVVLF